MNDFDQARNRINSQRRRNSISALHAPLHTAVKADRPEEAQRSTVANAGKPSEKQLAFLDDLRRDTRELANGNENRTAVLDILDKNSGQISTSAMIDSLKELRTNWRQDDRQAAPKSSTASEVEPEAGMYRLEDGTIVRVYLGQRSGKMLAKKLVTDGDHHEYEYMGKATRFVKADTAKLSLEEAKEFGRMTGTCCVCARRLDNPESVEAGIGPVCAKGF